MLLSKGGPSSKTLNAHTSICRGGPTAATNLAEHYAILITAAIKHRHDIEPCAYDHKSTWHVWLVSARALYSTAQHSTAQHSTTRQGKAQNSKTHRSTRTGAVTVSLPGPQPVVIQLLQQGSHAAIQVQALAPPGSLISRGQKRHLCLHAACAVCHDAVKLLQAVHCRLQHNTA